MPDSRVRAVRGSISRPCIRCAPLTKSDTMLRGRTIRIGVLHCGHSTFEGAGLPGLGRSTSATQSSRQDSWACRRHAHGDRHCDDVGVSSVSASKQIQHFFGSTLETAICGFGLECASARRSSGLGDGLGEVSENEGWLIKTVDELSDVEDWGMLDLRRGCVGGVSVAGNVDACCGDCCWPDVRRGVDAMLL